MASSLIHNEIKEELAYKLEKELLQMGITYYAYFVKKKHINSQPLVISNYPSEWVNQYIRDRLYNQDPVISYGMQRVAPFSWSQAIEKDVSPSSNTVFKLSSKFNITSGFSFPLHDPNNHFAALSICNQDQELCYSMSNAINPLMILLLRTHEAFSNLVPHSSPEQNLTSKIKEKELSFQLTKREIDVLHWISRGKTYPETAIILGISVRTVKFHIENITKKMNVSNAKHAIYKAKHDNLI